MQDMVHVAFLVINKLTKFNLLKLIVIFPIFV